MRTQEEREAYCKRPIFGTNLDQPTSKCISDVRAKMLEARDMLSDIMHGKGWEDRVDHVKGLLTCGVVALHNSMEEIYKFEIKQQDHHQGPSLSFGSRGIGLDVTNGCFVCGAERRNLLDATNHYMHNIAAFVDKEDEAAVFALFPKGSRMGYYHGDENIPQIKIGACDKHLTNLQHLHDRTCYYRRIRREDVDAAINIQLSEIEKTA
jgi:hypothetical protein